MARLPEFCTVNNVTITLEDRNNDDQFDRIIVEQFPMKDQSGNIVGGHTITTVTSAQFNTMGLSLNCAARLKSGGVLEYIQAIVTNFKRPNDMTIETRDMSVKTKD